MMVEAPNIPQRSIPAKCAGCQQSLDSPLFCSTCRRLYPAEGLDCFELLGLETSFDLDDAEVRRKYFTLAREIHPDRAAAGNPAALQLSMRVSARVNEAYRVLLDPILRAGYLLELAGGPSAADDKSVPQEVLVDTLELREEIEEASSDGNEATLAALRETVGLRFDGLMKQIADTARKLPGDQQTRKTLRGKLNAIRYYQKMRERL